MMFEVILSRLLMLERDSFGNIAVSLNPNRNGSDSWWWNKGLENGPRFGYTNVFYDLRYDLFWSSPGFYLFKGTDLGIPYPVTVLAYTQRGIPQLEPAHVIKLPEGTAFWECPTFCGNVARFIAEGETVLFEAKRQYTGEWNYEAAG